MKCPIFLDLEQFRWFPAIWSQFTDIFRQLPVVLRQFNMAHCGIFPFDMPGLLDHVRLNTGVGPPKSSLSLSKHSVPLQNCGPCKRMGTLRDPPPSVRRIGENMAEGEGGYFSKRGWGRVFLKQGLGEGIYQTGAGGGYLSNRVWGGYLSNRVWGRVFIKQGLGEGISQTGSGAYLSNRGWGRVFIKECGWGGYCSKGEVEGRHSRLLYFEGDRLKENNIAGHGSTPSLEGGGSRYGWVCAKIDFRKYYFERSVAKFFSKFAMRFSNGQKGIV